MPKADAPAPARNGPAVRRVTRRHVPPPVEVDDVLSEAVPVGEVGAQFLKFLIYGPNRTGKTTLACQFEKPLLLVSFEPAQSGGAISVRKVPGVKYLRLTSTERALKLAHQLASGAVCDLPGYEGMPYATSVLDGATSYQDLVLKEILGVEKLPEQLNFGEVSGDDYRRRAERTKEGLRPWVDLPMHTVFLAKEKDHNPPKEEKTNPKTGKVSPDMRPRFLRGLQQESFVGAEIGGATLGWLMDSCDYMGRLYFDQEVRVHRYKAGNEMRESVEPTGKYVRTLRIGYHPNFAAGFRSDSPESLPDEIPYPTYDKIIAAVEGRYRAEDPPAE